MELVLVVLAVLVLVVWAGGRSRYGPVYAWWDPSGLLLLVLFIVLVAALISGWRLA